MSETLCTQGPKRLKASQDLGTDSRCRESAVALLKSVGLCRFTPGKGVDLGVLSLLKLLCSFREFTVSLLNCSKDLQYLKPLKLYLKNLQYFWQNLPFGRIQG